MSLTIFPRMVLRIIRASMCLLNASLIAVNDINHAERNLASGNLADDRFQGLCDRQPPSW